MISMTSIKRVDLSITVSAGGTASATFQALGHIKLICFKAGGLSYDYDLTDVSSYGLNGKTGQSGNVTIACDVLVDDLCTLTLSNATNGTYNIRLYIDLSA